jgi:hypothetical protein
MNNNNIYTIIDFPNENQTYGKFEGKTPKKAAEKALSFLINLINKNNSNEDDLLGKFVVFVIKNKNTNKSYKYIGSRIKLKNPVKKFNSNGIVKKYYYKNVIGKYKPELDLI